MEYFTSNKKLRELQETDSAKGLSKSKTKCSQTLI